MVVVGIGSRNPVKIEAVKEAFSEFFDDVVVKQVNVNSFDQPYDHQIVSGARLRAQETMREGVDYAIGLEGGVIDLYGTPYLTAFCLVLNNDGMEHGGWSPLIEMPEQVMTRMRNGSKELGDVMDEILGRENIKHQEGAFGIWTKGRINRKQSLKHAVITALSPFL